MISADAASSFDLQVNGCGGVDFNRDGLTDDDLHTACARREADGGAGLLATISRSRGPDVRATRHGRAARARPAGRA
jgi:N-acetylglucosamine-6-phosphate deacetylase